MIRLLITGEGIPASVKDLDKDEILLGRSEETDIRLEGDMVSRRHARLNKQEDGTWRVADLGAANGVFVQRGGVPPATRVIVDEIRSGDVLCIERYKIVFEIHAGSSARPPDADHRPSFSPETFTRVTTLPGFQRAELDAVLKAREGKEKEPEARKADDGASLAAMIALSGGSVQRLSRGGTGTESAPSASGSTRPFLEILEDGAAHARRVLLGPAPIQFGSDPGCDVRMSGLTVPRYLCTVELRGDKVIVKRVSTGILGPKVVVDEASIKEAEVGQQQPFFVGTIRCTYVRA